MLGQPFESLVADHKLDPLFFQLLCQEPHFLLGHLANDLLREAAEESEYEETIVSTERDEMPAEIDAVDEANAVLREASAPASTPSDASEAAHEVADSLIEESDGESASAPVADVAAAGAQDAPAPGATDSVSSEATDARSGSDEEPSATDESKQLEDESKADAGYRAVRPKTPPPVLPEVKIPRVGEGKFGGKPAGESSPID